MDSAVSNKQLIVASIPDDSYYKDSLKDIEDFVRRMNEKTKDFDDFLVIISRNYFKRYRQKLVEKLGDNCRYLVVDNNDGLDLWMRDFSLILPKKQIQFAYKPKYLKSKETKYVQGSFNQALANIGVSLQASEIVLDGGNVVDNNQDKVIISERVLVENKGKSKSSLKHEIEEVLQTPVAFIPDPQCTTGHADGVVSFIDENLLIIADYNDQLYNEIEKSIKSEFPEMVTIALRCHEEGSKWQGFTSAAGCYANILVTNNALYVPQFGDRTHDSKALDLIRKHSSKKVVAIDTAKLCHMGGNVRCLTWQLESSHSIAQALYKHSEITSK